MRERHWITLTNHTEENLRRIFVSIFRIIVPVSYVIEEREKIIGQF
jgi:hypothetical protein